MASPFWLAMSDYLHTVVPDLGSLVSGSGVLKPQKQVTTERPSVSGCIGLVYPQLISGVQHRHSRPQ